MFGLVVLLFTLSCCSLGFAGKLQTMKPGVRSVVCQQILVCSTFRNLSLTQHHNPVCLSNRRKTMGDDQGCPARHKSFKGFQNGLLGPAVERAGWFIENQDGGIL